MCVCVSVCVCVCVCVCDYMRAFVSVRVNGVCVLGVGVTDVSLHDALVEA